MKEFARAKLNQFVPAQRRKGLFTALAITFVCYAIFQSVLWPVKVLGESMLPTYDDGTRHYVNRLAYWSEKPRRGDVVTLRIRDGEIFIKRVVGLPGERVEFKGGRIVINGQLLREQYTGTTIPWKMDAVELGADDYFVIGDNRTVSLLGAVPEDRIIGKVVF